MPKKGRAKIGGTAAAINAVLEEGVRRATAGLSAAEHITRARELKAEGNAAFLAGDYRAALAAHRRGDARDESASSRRRPRRRSVYRERRD